VDCQLIVVGSVEQSKKILSYYASKSLPITYKGHLPQDDLKYFLSEAEIYIYPSLTDGCASSGMEAMAAGLCVVATRESGLPITDGETGFFIPSKDPVAIADKVEWLSKNPGIIERAGRAAAKLISEYFTWDHYSEKVVKIYNKVLNSTGTYSN